MTKMFPPRTNKTMKLKLIAVILACTAISAQAHLIDLTPDGFSNENPLTQQQQNALIKLFQQQFFDQAAHGFFNLPEGDMFLDGWVSRFGILNGGTFFNVHDFFGLDVDGAGASWDMTGEPNGFWMTMLYVTGVEDGTLWTNIYRVSFGERFQGDGIVVAHDGVKINGISFYGINVSDTGTTLVLFLVGLAAVIIAWRLFEKHYVKDVVNRTKP